MNNFVYFASSTLLPLVGICNYLFIKTNFTRIDHKQQGLHLVRCNSVLYTLSLCMEFWFMKFHVMYSLFRKITKIFKSSFCSLEIVYLAQSIASRDFQ